MVSHLETGSDSPIGSDWDRGRDNMNEQRSYHFKPNLNLPTHNNSTLRNHENFS